MEWVVIWFICGIISAMIGSRKGEGCGAFIIGVLLGPFGILITIFSKGNRKECPFCKELIHREATVCPHCQREVAAEKLQIASEPESASPVGSIRKGLLSNTERLIIVAIFVVIALVVLYVNTKTPDGSSNIATDKSSSRLTSGGSVAQSNARAPPYKVVEQWSITNGGFGRVIVVAPNPTEADLHALGKKLRHDTSNERNAAVFVYDDSRAADNRLAAFSDKLPKAKLQHHDRHLVAMYNRNANTGFHEIDIMPRGLDGPHVNVKY